MVRVRSIAFLLLIACLASSAKAQHPAVQAAIDAVSIDSLVLDLRLLTGELPVDVGNGPQVIVSRNKNQPGNPLSADWLQQRMQQLGFAPVVQGFSNGTGGNILAEKPGLVHPERKVIICGHYDALPGGPVAAPAADDDGSGTVAVLEAMRVLRDIPFENTVVFALWDEEEQGRLGSIYYAGVAAASDVQITGVVNMDAIAYDGDGDGLMRVHTRNMANSVALKDSALLVNTLYGLDIPIAVNLPGATYSDHASFWNEGYGAILVIEDFDNDGNPHYHTSTDVVEHIDQPYFHGLARLGIGTAAVLAKPMAAVNTGLQSVDDAMSLYAWPNPTVGPVRIGRERAGGPAMVEVLDPLGRLVEQHRLATGQRSIALDLGGRAPGTYTIRVQAGADVRGVRVLRLP